MSSSPDQTRADPLIVYVDDDGANRMVFAHTFGSRFNITVAATPSDALEILEHEPVAVLVTDQRMPEMSGNELLRLVKDTHPSVVRMVITAYSDLDAILAAVNEGLVARYVVKPWDQAQLGELLTWACEAHALSARGLAVQARLLRTERLAMLGSVATAVLHDIKQPMTASLANARQLARFAKALALAEPLLRDGDSPLDSDERAELEACIHGLPDVAADILRGTAMVWDMLERLPELLGYGRGRAPTSADPISVIRYALSVCDEARAYSGAQVRYVGAEHLPEVQLEPAKLLQVVMNLLLNALHAMEQSGCGGCVEVDASSKATGVNIEVRDDGPGMTPQVLKEATNEFFSTRPDGTGLGLTQCQRIVGGAGGRFEIESREGHGTTVSLWLPPAPP